MRLRGTLFAAMLVLGSWGIAAPASAHPGGLDKNGGHWCRPAGAKSGKCRLGQYLCHRPGCKPKPDFGPGW